MKNKQCIVCSGVSFNQLFEGILKCEGCGYVFADLDLTDKEFERIYNSEYFHGKEYSNYILDKNILQKNFNKRLKVLKRYIKPGYHNSLLEIGCAYGFFLEIAQKIIPYVEGIDITEEGIIYAKDVLNLNAIRGDFLDYELNNKRYDIVCMWDTIEHLQNPNLYLEKISKNITTGGLLAITTGDIDSIIARIRKRKWRLIHPPTHAHYFSKKTLHLLLEKYGFSILYHRYCGFYRSIDNIIYNIFVLRKDMEFIYKIIKNIGINKVSLYMNLYDIRYVIAKKN